MFQNIFEEDGKEWYKGKVENVKVLELKRIFLICRLHCGTGVCNGQRWTRHVAHAAQVLHPWAAASIPHRIFHASVYRCDYHDVISARQRGNIMLTKVLFSMLLFNSARRSPYIPCKYVFEKCVVNPVFEKLSF